MTVTVVNLMFSSHSDHAGMQSVHRMVGEAIEEKGARLINVFLTGECRELSGFSTSTSFWNISPKTLRKKGWLSKLRYRSCCQRLAALLDEVKPDVVICDGITAIRLMTEVQCTHQIKGLGVFHGQTRFKPIDESILSKHKKLWHFVAVSEALKTQLITACSVFDDQCLHVVPNAIDFAALDKVRLSASDARDALGLQNNMFVFGCIGRLTAIKRHSIIISAVAILKQNQRWPANTQIVIIGEGELEQTLREQIAVLHLQQEVLLLGAKSEAARYVEAFDVFVMPSAKGEAFGLVLLEGCAAKLPVIATQIPVFEIITGELAVYFPEDDASALAEQMHLMLLSQAEREERGSQLYHYTKQLFDTDSFKQAYWQLIKKVIE